MADEIRLTEQEGEQLLAVARETVRHKLLGGRSAIVRDQITSVLSAVVAPS